MTYESVVHLLHEATWGGLSTHSVEVPGYPFASVVPYAPDEFHHPLFLISDLAEHTKNLMADRRASFLVQKDDGENVLGRERLSIVGDVVKVVPSDALIARYLRYQPDAEQYLALAGFHFFHLVPLHARYIAGFGQMRWLSIQQKSPSAAITPEHEAQMILSIGEVQPPGVRVLGIDRYGFDIEKDGQRERQRFAKAPVSDDQIEAVVRRFLVALLP